MRSWGNRPDTFVCDEPFYACYLQATAATIRALLKSSRRRNDWREGGRAITGPIPGGKRIFFQKPDDASSVARRFDRAGGALTNCFLIPRPGEVIRFLHQEEQRSDAGRHGFVQQAGIFEWVREHTGQIPPVIRRA